MIFESDDIIKGEGEMMNAQIQTKLANLPEQPGSYQMLDQHNQIIYVGKAKNLRARVRSYFVGSHDLKTTKLVSMIEDFTYIVTKSETEAFLLELSLIKEHSPKYNILLMDDKTYPYIEVTTETHPRIQITRKVDKKNKLLFGPFPNVSAARDTVDLLGRLFPLRKCQPMPKKLCLYYHIGQCMGPCVHPITQQDYQPIFNQIKAFFRGQNTEILDRLKTDMNRFASNLEFEKAQEMKLLIQAVIDTTTKQQIIFPDVVDRDIFAYEEKDSYVTITILFMRQGKITFSESKIMQIFQDAEEAFLEFIALFYQRHPLPKEILIPAHVDGTILQSVCEERLLQPQRGKKKELVQMAQKNAAIYMENHLDLHLKKELKLTQALNELSRITQIDALRRIECFDNSHTMGKNQVSSMVVFKDGIPDKKSYRKYQTKYASSGDDLQAMKEVLYRRLQKMLENQSLDVPDLIILDGGITQLRAAKEVRDSLYLTIPLVSLKKDEYHKTDTLLLEDERSIKLDRHHPVYVFLSRVQEEAHRFAITYHREKQTKQILSSILDAIPGIGPATKKRLLDHFKTIPNIRQATDEELKVCQCTSTQITNLRIALQTKAE